MPEHLQEASAATQSSGMFWSDLAQRLAEGAREAEDTGDTRALYAALADYDRADMEPWIDRVPEDVQCLCEFAGNQHEDDCPVTGWARKLKADHDAA